MYIWETKNWPIFQWDTSHMLTSGLPEHKEQNDGLVELIIDAGRL